MEYMHPKPSSHSGRIVSNPEIGGSLPNSPSHGRMAIVYTHQACGLCVCMVAGAGSEVPGALCELVTRAKDYSYLKATIGSTRIARRAGM